MKKIYSGFFLWLLLSAVLGSWRPGVNRNFLRGDIVAYVQSDAAVDYLIPQNLEELEAGCTDIVQGVFRGTGNRQANQHVMAESDFTVEDGAGNVMLGALEFPDRTVTVSSLQITKVLKGGLRAGQAIPLGEEYHREEKDGKGKIYYNLDYLPSTAGREYLFFLNEDNDASSTFYGLYSPYSGAWGRYRVRSAEELKTRSVDSMIKWELEFGRDSADDYKSIYKEVIAKYMS
ncbi:hypothetical protein A7X67_11555 [Clostridium sp. W14A]|nr:hypothetical protein A7X67_11555 [Clostridium sp. W14A]